MELKVIKNDSQIELNWMYSEKKNHLTKKKPYIKLAVFDVEERLYILET